MARNYYSLDPAPEYTEQVEMLLNSDPVRAEDSFFQRLLLRILNNIKAVKLLIDAARAVADAALPASQKGQPGGVASLGANGKLAQMPTAADVGARPANWTPDAAGVGAVPVTRKVNGKALSADISLTKGDVGLGSVDNTADSVKRVSYAATAGSAAANGGTSAACSGNAATATKLQTARKINGVAFDGTKDVTVTAAPTAHNHGAGDLTSGTLPVARGGTGNTTGNASACNGLTFAVAAAVPGYVANRVTFVYG